MLELDRGKVVFQVFNGHLIIRVKENNDFGNTFLEQALDGIYCDGGYNMACIHQPTVSWTPLRIFRVGDDCCCHVPLLWFNSTLVRFLFLIILLFGKFGIPILTILF